MIAKQVQGSDFKKVLDYVHGKSGAKLIGSNMAGKEPDTLASEFRTSSDLRRRVSKCVYHVSLSLSPSENVSEEKWMDIARAYLEGMEFKRNQYAVYRHCAPEGISAKGGVRDHDHIHIIASRISIVDGSVVRDSWNYRRSEKLLRQLEQQFGLSPTPCSWEKKKRSPKTGEVRRQRRTGEVTTRSQIQRLIEQSLQGNPNLEEFIRRLEAKEVSVRLRKSQEGKIQGISYGLNGIAFQGRQLGRDYSWTALESVLAEETSAQSHAIAQPEPIAVATENNVSNDVSHQNSIASPQIGETARAIAPTEPNAIPAANSVEGDANAQNPSIARAKPIDDATAATVNHAPEGDELEREKKRLRAKYLSLASQVRQLPQFEGREGKEVDIAVTILSLKSGDDVKEAKLGLTQSDRVRQWHQELPRDDYLKVAAQYIQEVSRRAIRLTQKHGHMDKGVDLER